MTDKSQRLVALQTKARMTELSQEERKELDALLIEYVMKKNHKALAYLSRKSDE